MTEDQDFFLKAMEGVQKLEQPNSVLCRKKKKIVTKKTDATCSICKNFDHDVCLNTVSDIDKNTLRRFKKEEFGVEATLDLHGLTIDAAHSAVQNFIISSYNKNKRAVLIVTGKGLCHEDQDAFAPHGVLKQSVPLWLQSEALAPMILTYIHPSLKLGGSGALYILLRRNRRI